MNRPTDDEIQAAKSVLRRDYYGAVQSVAEEIVKQVKAGGDLDDLVAQATQQTYWDIYYHAAYQCVYVSDNSGAAYEELVDMGYSDFGDHGHICTVANLCYKFDVREAAERLLGDV